MRRVLLRVIPALIILGVMQAEDLVMNFDTEVRDYSIVKIEDSIKKEILGEKLSFYTNKLSKKKNIKVENDKKKVENKNNTKDISNNKKHLNYIITENKTISELLNTIGRSEGKVYILRDKDFLIKEGYKISGTNDLIKLVRLVSNFKLVLTKTDIVNTFYVNLKLKEDTKTLSIEANVDLDGLRRVVMNEYGIRTIISNELIKTQKKEKFKLFGTYTISELMKDFEAQSDLWFNLKGKKLYINDTKEIIFDIKRDGEFSIDFTTQSSASTGSDAGDSEASTGFSFKLEDYNSEKFLATLKENFPKIIFKKSYSGFVVAEVTPGQYKKVTNYFKNVEERHQLITGEIVLLNLKTNDSFKYNFSWQDFLLKQNILNLGHNGMLSLGSVTSLMGAVKEESSEGFRLGINSHTKHSINGSNDRELGFIEALSDVGDVSIVDKWTISTATGIPTGFTNYIKIPYYTEDQNQAMNQTMGLSQEQTDTQSGQIPISQETIFKLNYALTGFKVTFRVNKTKESSYVIDGAIDYSGITGWKGDKKGSNAPEIQGKSMRIYSELNKLNKTIVIGGFKNLENIDKSLRTPLLGSLPLIGWLFKSEDQKAQESEFILLIKLTTPTLLNEKDIVKKYKTLDGFDEPLELNRDEVEEDFIETIF